MVGFINNPIPKIPTQPKPEPLLKFHIPGSHTQRKLEAYKTEEAKVNKGIIPNKINSNPKIVNQAININTNEMERREPPKRNVLRYRDQMKRIDKSQDMTKENLSTSVHKFGITIQSLRSLFSIKYKENRCR